MGNRSRHLLGTLKGPAIAFAFAVAVIVAGILFDPPRRCHAGSTPGPRIGGSILIEGCP